MRSTKFICVYGFFKVDWHDKSSMIGLADWIVELSSTNRNPTRISDLLIRIRLGYPSKQGGVDLP